MQLEVTDDVIRQFNLFRVNMQRRKLSLIEMGKELKKKTGLPGSLTFVSSLSKCKNPPIVRNEDSTYSVSETPVHKEKLQWCIDEYKKCIASKAEKANTSCPVDEAIALLKSKGYKILKPKVEWQEI